MMGQNSVILEMLQGLFSVIWFLPWGMVVDYIPQYQHKYRRNGLASLLGIFGSKKSGGSQHRNQHHQLGDKFLTEKDQFD